MRLKHIEVLIEVLLVDELGATIAINFKRIKQILKLNEKKFFDGTSHCISSYKNKILQ